MDTTLPSGCKPDPPRPLTILNASALTTREKLALHGAGFLVDNRCNRCGERFFGYAHFGCDSALERERR